MTEQEYRELELLLGGLQAVDLLNKKTIERLDNCLNVIHRDKKLLIHSVVVPKGTLCEYCGEKLKEGTSIDYCKNDYCTQ
jgi:uncharacterized protein VirK/YbjX